MKLLKEGNFEIILALVRQCNTLDTAMTESTVKISIPGNHLMPGLLEKEIFISNH